jgi:hypothetical protein
MKIASKYAVSYTQLLDSCAGQGDRQSYYILDWAFILLCMGELPNLDRLLEWTAVCLRKEIYLQCHGWLQWLKEWGWNVLQQGGSHSAQSS